MKTEKWLRKLNGNPIDWMLDSDPWIKYKTLTDLLDLSPESKNVQSAHEDLLNHKMIKQLIKEASDWMPKAASRNNDPQISYFKLRMLSDFGLNSDDKGIKEIYNKAAMHIQDGLFSCRGQIPERPKKGEKFEKPDPKADVWHISPCNSPLITYALLSLGFRTDLLQESADRLKSLWNKETGWFCHFFFVDSQFKKEQAGCPMAGMMALDVFSLLSDRDNMKNLSVHNAYAAVKFHKEYGKTLYYFGRSKKFWTFKYPFVWYNGLYLADILSRFESFKKTPILKECIDWIITNQDNRGRFKPTSVFIPYKNWDFGNKKEPSPWITFLCCRILKRYFS